MPFFAISAQGQNFVTCQRIFKILFPTEMYDQVLLKYPSLGGVLMGLESLN